MTTVFVHGGVAGWRRASPDLGYAVRAGAAAPGALDAVEAAVRALEDDASLNAGYGACLTRQGKLELDAGIATGGRAGGVAGVRVRHPISLARRVLEDSPHVLMAGPGAEGLAPGMEVLSETSPEQHRRWEEARARGELEALPYGAPEHVDTVGAVALDRTGLLAAGSSTGGVFGQLPGRVGDAPVYGAGVYASAEVAVVGTGVGELFLETLACARAGREVEDGFDPQAACEHVIALLGQRARSAAGLLALDADGRAGAAYRGASWAVWGPDGSFEAVSVPR